MTLSDLGWHERDDWTPVPCRVTGVYGTVHTNHGDLVTEGPTRVVIDCELIEFHLPIRVLPFSGVMQSFTLHFGTTSVEVGMPARTSFRAGDGMTVVMPVSMADMEAVNPVRR